MTGIVGTGDWRQARAKLDDLMAKSRERPYPPGLMEARLVGQMEFHLAMAAEIDHVIAETRKDPEAWARLNRPH